MLRMFSLKNIFLASHVIIFFFFFFFINDENKQYILKWNQNTVIANNNIKTIVVIAEKLSMKITFGTSEIKKKNHKFQLPIAKIK